MVQIGETIRAAHPHLKIGDIFIENGTLYMIKHVTSNSAYAFKVTRYTTIKGCRFIEM